MNELKHINDKDPWMLGEDIPDCDLFFSQIWLTVFVNEFKYPSGRAYKKIMTIFRGYHLWFYFGEKDAYEEGKFIVNKFVRQPEFTKEINKQIVVEADKLRKFADNLPEENLEKLSNRQLWNYYSNWDKIHSHYYQWCWIPVAADMFHDNLTERLKRYLRSIDVTEDKVNEYLVLLTQPTKKSLIQIEQEEFLQIAEKIYKDKEQKKVFKEYYKILHEEATKQYGLNTHSPKFESYLEKKMSKLRDNIDKNIMKDLEKHYQKYFYVKFMWIGKEGVNSFDYYLKEMVKLIGAGTNPTITLNKQEKEFKQTLKRRQDLIKKLKVKNPWRTIIDSWGDFMVTKIYRRYAQIYAIYKMQVVLEEIARRLKINLKQMRFMLTNEVKEALINNKINRNELKERTKFCVHYAEKGQEKVFIGKEAKELAKKLEQKKINEVDEIKGQTGCIGKAQGEVKIIIRPKDMEKMRKGDILVSIATDPDIVPAMKKAAAIVTEQGGVTSHAAIVSREMNIPCLIGTKIATKAFKDGDMVEVDAAKGIVRKIK